MTDDHNATAREGDDEEQIRAVEVVLVRYVYSTCTSARLGYG
jgi:hypothetical protein